MSTQGISKKFNLLNEEKQRLNVYHVEQMEEAFKGREGKPSHRIFETKKGKRAIEGLKMIESEMNESWYSAIKDRWTDRQDKEAIFYRGNVITAKEMFERADAVSRSLLEIGVEKGDELACCMSNVPEVLYLMLGANQIGAKLNFFGAHYNPEFIDIILSECSQKVLFITDDEAEKIMDKVKAVPYDHKVIISLADSLPENPEKCEGYEKHLASYYNYENKAVKQIADANDDAFHTFADFADFGKNYTGSIIDDNGLDTEFLVTYTSGSTKVGFPKREIHRNRSLITVGVFHDPELCGNPAIHGLRGMAYIHTDSDTNLITMISDSLFQLWSVSFEPTYVRETFLDVLFLNKPNFVLGTTGFWLNAARDYYVNKRYHDANGKGRKLDFILAAMAVGENCQPGEERLINAFLKEARAGSAVNLAGPIHFPYVTIGVGGGDTEHGGIYYSLWRRMFEVLNKPKLHGKPYGMAPVPYAQATVVKEVDGKYVECDYEEYGIIVANSATTMAGYRHFDKVREKVITDEYGIDWLSCDVFGYIDKMGNIHMKDRKDSLVTLDDGREFLPFRMVDAIQKAPRDVLSSVVTTAEVNGKTHFIVNFEVSPLTKLSEEKVILNLDKTLRESFPEIYDRVVYRQFDEKHPFPVTAAGKRNMVAVANMGAEDIYSISKNAELVPITF